MQSSFLRLSSSPWIERVNYIYLVIQLELISAISPSEHIGQNFCVVFKVIYYGPHSNQNQINTFFLSQSDHWLSVLALTLASDIGIVGVGAKGRSESVYLHSQAPSHLTNKSQLTTKNLSRLEWWQGAEDECVYSYWKALFIKCCYVFSKQGVSIIKGEKSCRKHDLVWTIGDACIVSHILDILKGVEHCVKKEYRYIWSI